MTGGGGAEINFGGPREVYLCEFEGGTGSLLECGTNKKGEDQKKKKVFSTKISTNSSCCLKILTISHEFLSEDQKKTGLCLKRFMKSGVSPQKLRKNSSCSRILER